MSKNPIHLGQAQNVKGKSRGQIPSRKRWPFLIIAVCAFAVIASLVVLGTSSMLFSEADMQTSRLDSARTGTIVRQTDANRCEHMKFDNDSGRTLENFKSCKNAVVLDSRGVPVPMGTVHRLDAISKSFFRDGH
jgi:hypothetical protein